MALIQTKTGSELAGSATPTFTWGSNTSTGDTIIVGLTNDSGVVNNITSVTDSQSNTYTKIDEHIDGGTPAIASVSLWVAENITGGTTPTITVHAAGLYNIAFIAREYSGLATASSDKHASNGQLNTASPTSGASAATTQASELVIGYGGSSDSGNTWTAGSSYANAITQAAGVAVDSGMEDKTVAATGAQTATFTITNLSNTATIVATFKTASASTPTGWQQPISQPTAHFRPISGSY